MFLTNKQTILLSAIVTVCFFLGGVMGILDNFMVIIVILFGFLAVIVNLIIAIRNKKNPD